MKQKLISKFLACLLGAFIGFSLTAVAQVPSVNLRGTGGNTIAQVTGPIYGTGGNTVEVVPNVGSGGTVTTVGADTVHTFTGSGTFVAPVGVTSVRVLVVGGGGGGARGTAGTSAGGGGGGGGVIDATVAVTPTFPIAITVGGSGPAGATNNSIGSVGTASVYNTAPSNYNPATTTLTAGGGGNGTFNSNGGAGAAGTGAPINDGGSGGGGAGAGSAAAFTGGTAGANGGFAGGNSPNFSNANAAQRAGGGGGGSGSAGAAGTSNTGGAGGTGTSSNITGTAIVYGAGGGGSGANTGGAGGSGVGGNGGTSGVATAPTTPGSGGGGSRSQTATAGAAGVVIVRYTTPPAERVVHTFTGGGTFTPPAGLSSVAVFLVGGGGSGARGQSNTSSGGGGGAGALRYLPAVGVTGDQGVAVVVGAGGASQTGNNSNGAQGGTSQFGAAANNAVGGGGGSFGDANAAVNNGGSGGGAGSNATATNRNPGGTGTAGQGSAGGGNFAAAATGNNTARAGGGGGGAGSAGVTATTGTGGNGGAGLTSYITGTDVIYAAGGGGSGGVNGSTGGSAGVGGAGGAVNGAAGAGTTNRGSGGGGTRGANSGAGSAGIVVVTYVPPNGTYILHTFTSSGSFIPPPGVSNVHVLTVGGGGGGGGRHGGGGGGGGVVFNPSFAVSSGNSYNVVVGNGGVGQFTNPPTNNNGTVGTNGANSSFGGTMVALGGGGGGSYTAVAPTGGGSGGGGGGLGPTTAGTCDGCAENRNGGAANQGASGDGTGYGNAGGTGAGPGATADMTGGGGGGGAGAAGAIASGNTGGAGGSGFLSAITGSNQYYSGGGGGGSGLAVMSPAAGGQGGGGNGGANGGAGAAGTANTGGGGGGSRSDPTTNAGGAGGSGIVFVAYRPSTMDFTQQPSASMPPDIAIPQQPIVRIRTATGAVVNGVNVTAAIDSGTATLGGTATVATAGGLATFTNLQLNSASGTVRLGFTAAGTDPAFKVVSNDISISGAAATCTGTNAVPSGGSIEYRGCVQNSVTTGTSLIVGTPAATQIGDYLLAVIATDGNQTIVAPAGWDAVNLGQSNGNAASMAIFSRSAAAAGAQNHSFTWGGSEEAFGYIMRFTGTDGIDPAEVLVTTGSVIVPNATTPAITTGLDNSLVLRIGAFDNGLVNVDPATTIITGYNNVTQGRSSAAAASVSSAAAWINVPTAGASAAVAFASAPTGTEETRRVTLVLRPIPSTLPSFCTGTNAIPSGGPIAYEGCLDNRVTGTQITLSTPAATDVTDYLLAVVATDGGTTIAAPAGWDTINAGQSNGNAASLAVFGRFATTTGAQNYNFTWAGSEEAYGYIMRFTGAQGIVPAEVAAATGNGPNVTTPAVTTAVANSLIVRIGAFDSNLVNLNPGTIIPSPSHNNITQARSSADTDNSVSSAAAWVNQPVAGGSGGPAFGSAPTIAEESRRVTLALRPMQAGPPLCTGTNTIASGGPIEYRGCVQTSVAGNNTAITLSTPAATQIGDYLLAVVATDGNRTIAAPAGWDVVNLGQSNPAAPATPEASLAIYSRFADTAGAQNHNFTWTGNEEAFGYIMRFTGTDGVAELALLNDVSGTNLTTPAVTTAVNNSLVLRIGAFDNGLLDLNPAAIVDGYNNITQGRSSAVAASVSSAAAWINVPTAGTSGALPFTGAPTTSSAARRVTLTLRPSLLGPAQCMDANAIPSGGVVEYGGCVQNSITTEGPQITVNTPSGVQEGDYLLAVVTTDGNRTITGTGWTPLNTTSDDQTNGDTASIRVLGRFAVASEPASHTFTWGANEEAFAYIMRFTGTQGVNPAEIVANLSGSVLAPNATTPAVTTGVANSLIVRIGVFDHNDVIQNPAIVIDDHNNITQNRSSTTANSVSSGAAWINQPSAGSSGTAFFTNAPMALNAPGTDTEESRRITLALRPSVGFRFLHGGSAQACGFNVITIEAIAGTGINTAYTGPVDLSTGSGGYWTKVGGDANGTLVPGNGDGTATYTFVPADNGTVDLVFYRPGTGAVNFNIIDGNGSQELPGMDPSLTLTTCTGTGYFGISHVGTSGVCAPTAITISARTPQATVDTGYTGSVTVSALGSGNWTAPGANGSFDNGALNDGIATYTFAPADNGQVVLYFMPAGPGTVNFNVADTGNPARVVLPFAAFDPDLVLENCEYRISHDTNGNACSVDDVTISVVTSSNAPVNGYTGSINLSTSSITTDKGTWSLGSGAGTFADPVLQDGLASYQFAAADNGVVTLRFLQTDEGTVNFGVTGNSLSVNPANDQDLIVGGCSFRIDTDLDGNVCTAETVTVTVVDDGGNTLTNFTGTVTLSTSSLQGAWAQIGPNGTLVPGGGNGGATFTFSLANAGIANLSFLHPVVNAAVDIDVTFGIYEDDNPVFDDPLNIIACPSGPVPFGLPSCSNTSNSITTISLPPAGTNRLALVTVHRTGNLGAPPPNGTMTFAGTGMTLIYEAEIDSAAVDNQTQIWGLLDAALPGTAGPHTVTAQALGTTRICVLIYQNMDQSALTVPPRMANSLLLDNTGTSITTTLGAIVQSFTANNPTGFVPPMGVTQFDALLVGGGGGGGGYQGGSGGGGGGGVRWLSSQTVSQPSYAVTIGTGGTGGSNSATAGDGNPGTVTSLGPLQVNGGGGGMRGNQAAGNAPAPPTPDGGSGGGGGSTADNTETRAGANGGTFGSDGGNGGSSNTADNQRAGGGGGAGANAVDLGGGGGNAGAGGAGLDVSAGIYNLGTTIGVTGIFGGGGGGGKRNATGGTGGAGGAGGGAAGSNTGSSADATANTGGGGGGRGGTGSAANTSDGGSGFVLVRYVDPTTLSGNALIISAASATFTTTATRTWTSTLADSLWNQGNAANLTFGVSSGYEPSPGAVTVTQTHDGGNSNRRTHVLAGFRPITLTLNHFRITHNGAGGTCAPNAVTITAVDQFGGTLTSYTGTVDLEAGGAGTWGQGTATNVPGNGAPGEATYTFAAADQGVATLAYSRVGAATVNFHVEDGSIEESPFFDASMNLDACHFRISYSGAGSVCTPNAVTLSVRDAGGNPMPLYTGAVDISTVAVPGPGSGAGTWSLHTGAGTVVDTTPNDGIASYTFAAADQGQVILNYTRTSLGTLNINLNASGIVELPAFDPNLVIGTCFFRISYPNGAGSDVCSAADVMITAVNAGGQTLTSYTGTVNLSTSTLKGDWAKPLSALGTLNNLGGGSASYTFHPGDNGVATLNLSHESTAASVNINLNDGSFQEDPAFDPHLAVVGCTFRISYSSPTATACTINTVTLAVYNSNNMPATGYAGVVTLTTSTSHGTWLSPAVDTSPGNGTGTYTFVPADGGTTNLPFTDSTVEIVNIIASANAGAITVDANFNPALSITACLPAVTSVACYASQSQANAIALPSRTESLGSRMVLMYVTREATNATPTPATGATINGVSMSQREYRNTTNNPALALQVYGILDADLPENAGTYSAAFTGSGSNSTMCIVALSGVKQQFPATASPATNGQINGSSSNSAAIISTGITTQDNNSIVLSVASTGANGGTITSSLANTLWAAGAAGEPGTLDWKGSWGRQPVSASITPSEDPSGTNSLTHIVLTLAPFVVGPPEADGYVPVTLFHTLSGKMNYRATGNTLRAASNTQSGGALVCLMVPEATGSAATLTIPTGSTIKTAYLYWAGSGGPGYAVPPPVGRPFVDAQVRFGVDGGSRPLITADGMFQILRPFGEPEEFFAGYKDVTGLISSNPTTTYRLSDLAVDTGAPWSGFATCVAGWGLVVVYENPNENLNVINLFHGFQPFWNSNFTLVPRNFRMATPNVTTGVPNGQITHITFEGDETLNTGEEVFQLQSTPLAMTFTELHNYLNLGNAQYNDTVSYPLYDANLKFDPTQGTAGYAGVNNSWGTDVDTYYMEGASPGQLLHPFGVAAAEQITTRYAAGQDMVLLVGEFISVTNAPIADLEVFVTDTGVWKVGATGTAQYRYTVTNNGDGTVPGGFADGQVILTGNMPTGITIAAIAAPGWNCALATTTAFTCVYNIATTDPSNQLTIGESLQVVEVTVNIGNETFFPLLNNDVTTVARLAHVGNYGTCPAEPAGVQPNPNPDTGGCDKSPQFDNVNDLNKYLIDIDDLTEEQTNNNNVRRYTRNIRGIETNLGIVKTLIGGILEANEPAQYLLTVTNFGLDATTKTITVTDTLPAGLVPDSAGGANWSCGILVQTVTCDRTVALGIGQSTAITIDIVSVSAPAIAGSFVSNSAAVAAGQYNFDLVPGNNSSTNITQVTGPLAAGTEKYLLSVNAGGTSIGGLDPFGDGDLVMYDPVTDTAEMFLAAADIPGVTSLGNIDALHLLPNGWIVLSTSTPGSMINGVPFEPEDLVLYDPILKTATLVFDGSAIFTGPPGDIDALHVFHNNSYTVNDWDFVISTTGAATIGALTFQNNDIVKYDVSATIATRLAEGADADMFNGPEGDIGGLYIRYQNSNQYVLTTSDEDALIGVSGEQQPFERGELVEIDLSNPGAPSTDPKFCDNTGGCVGAPPRDFDPSSNWLDAVHVVETGYFGHFAISSIGGDTCSATAITITKHKYVGMNQHVLDNTYRGSIIISNNLNAGVWGKDVTASGTITDLGGGTARYTFAPGDNGQVILFITGVAETANLNVNVRSNVMARDTVTRENSPTEDANIVISELAKDRIYKDEFNTAAYTNNNGVSFFAGGWTETGEATNGLPNAGKIRIVGGELRFNNSATHGGSGTPALTRTIDFSNYTVDTPPVLSFNWRIANADVGNTFVVEASDDNWATTTTLQTFPATPASGNASINFQTAGLDYDDTVHLRFRIGSGYDTNDGQFFYIDNVQVYTYTNDCGGAGDTVDHYHISHNGPGISCLITEVAVTPHSSTHSPVLPIPGTTLTLDTGTGKGTWGPPVSGGTPAAFTPMGIDVGVAGYVYQPVDQPTIHFPLSYTVAHPGFSIAVLENNIPKTGESPLLVINEAGLRFYNATLGSNNWPTLVAGIPSATYPAQDLVVRAVQADDEDTSVCVDVFGPGNTVPVELAFEMIDRLAYSSTVVPVFVNGEPVSPFEENATPDFAEVSLLFENVGDYVAAHLNLTYSDVGAMQIHGRYNIPFLEDLDGEVSDDYMVGSGAPNTNNPNDYNFVVRPFGYDIDFILPGNPNPDRKSTYDYMNENYNAVKSWALNAADPDWIARAGSALDTVVTAVAWDGDDDYEIDGNGVLRPVSGARLFDNSTTWNYGNEGDVDASHLTITHERSAVMPMGSVNGVLDDLLYPAPANFDANFRDTWEDGMSRQNMTYNEVGIIHLTATLDSGDYLGSGQPVISDLLNVGRFIPQSFTVSGPMLTPRPLFTPSAAPFTYMGEQFTAAFTLTARSSCPTGPCPVTQNYFGVFAKLTAPSQLNFFAVKDIGMAPDVNHSARLAKVLTGPVTPPYNPFPGTITWAAGVSNIDGNLIFSRQPGEAPEAPITQLQIALTAVDSDGVFDAGRTVDDDNFVVGCTLNCDTEPSTLNPNTYNLIGTHAWRYGRLRLENGYGSEIPDLDDLGDELGQDVAVRIVAEYWNGTNFVPNEHDIATPYDSDELDFVIGSYTGNLAPTEPAITSGVSGVVYQGGTMETELQNDTPLYLQAPGEGNEGSVIIELDLDALGLSFLKFDWRDGTGAGEDQYADVKADPNTYGTTDNPRSIIEFGTFRGNDRIINWQEIFQ